MGRPLTDARRPFTTNSHHRKTPPGDATQTVISLRALRPDMDDDTRQKLISIFLVLLMITSGVAYAASFF